MQQINAEELWPKFDRHRIKKIAKNLQQENRQGIYVSEEDCRRELVDFDPAFKDFDLRQLCDVQEDGQVWLPDFIHGLLQAKERCDPESARADSRSPSEIQHLHGHDHHHHRHRHQDEQDEMGDEPEAELAPEYMKMRMDRIHELKKQFQTVSGPDDRISLADFRSALSSDNELFTDRLFHMFDKTNDGRISMNEFISFIMRIETVDDKINLLFDLYDENHKGTISKEEVKTVISAMVKESRLMLSKEDVEELADAFYKQAMVETHRVSSGALGNEISRDGFRRVLRQSKLLSGDVSTLIDHWIGSVEDAKAKQSSSPQQRKEDKLIDMATMAMANPTFYAFLVLYLLVIAGMMGLAAWMHRGAKDKDGKPNYFLIAARIFGFPLNFVCTMVFVFMLRGFLNSLRELGMVRYLPLDHSLFFHVISGWIIFIFGFVHTMVHLINFKLNVQPDPENYLDKNKATKSKLGYHQPGEGGNYTYADWMLTPRPHLFGLLPGWANLTGIILMLIMTLMLLTSQECVRKRRCFNLFYYCHLCYVPFAILLIIHAPNFSYFFPVVGVFVVLDLIKKCFYGRLESYVRAGILLPSDAYCLVMKKPPNMAFSTGDWISVNIPSIAKYEWHAFTISSSPDVPDIFTLHIKAVGSWTKTLQKILQEDYKKYGRHDHTYVAKEFSTVPHQFSKVARIVLYDPPADGLKQVVSNHPHASKRIEGDRAKFPIAVKINGPYHAPATSIFRAEHAVLIATGIGVTPMASILHTVLYKHLDATHHCPKCDTKWIDENNISMGSLRKVDFIWIVRDPTEVSWFLDLLASIDLEQETLGSDLPKFIDTHIYVTRALANTDMCAVTLRIAMNLYYRKKKKDIVYGFKTKMVTGRPNLGEIFHDLDKTKQGLVSVYYCGNPKVGDILEKKCKAHYFRFHREVF